jgi:4'-phosphopantetheinyl transferase
MSARSPEAPAADIWVIRLDAPENRVNDAARLLTQEERGRAAAFLNPQASRNHILARAALRTILSTRLNVSPKEICIRTGPHGKPQLDPEHRSQVEFNLSHSGDVALLAITAAGCIGVDIEKIRTLPRRDRIAERYFFSSEVVALQQLAEAEKEAAFFRLWTCKEALAKARGRGLVQALSGFEVSLATSAVLSDMETGAQPGLWSMQSFEPVPGYIAAVAVPALGVHFEIHASPFH